MANSLLVQLGFKTDKSSVTSAVSGVNEITSAIKGLKKAANLLVVGQGLREFSAGIKSIAASAKSMVSSGFNFAEEFAKVGDSVAKTSRLVGLSVKDYQAFSSAARHAGMSTEEMDTALKKFNVNLAKARAGDKNSFKMFDSILGGRSLSNFKDSASLIAAVADGYAKLGSAEQKAFVSQELFGRSGLKMSELLSGGSGEINKLLADFEARGGGFSEEGAKRAEEFNDELQNMKETISSLKISVAQELFPSFIDLFKTVQTFVKDNRESLIPVVNEVFGKTTTLVKSLLPYIPKVLNSILSVVNAIGPGTIAIVAGVGSILPAVGHILFGLYQILPAIKLIIVPIKAIVTYGKGLLIGLKLIIGALSGPTLATIGLVATGIVSWGIAIKSVYDNLNLVPDALQWIFDTVKDSLLWYWNGFKSLIGRPVMAFIKSLPGAFSNLWEGFKAGISNIGSMLYDQIFGSVRRAISSVRSLVSNVPILGNLFGEETPSAGTLGSAVGQTVSETRTTTTSRFSVDFKNMPRGVQVTAPEKGDFDWSRGYVLGGV